MRKVLVGIDGSECGFRAVEYCGHQFGGLEDLSIVLLHVMPYLPPQFWDPGHIFSEEEQKRHRQLVERWAESQKQAVEPMFQTAIAILNRRGIEADRIQTKTTYDSTGVAESILEEARTGGYLTLVIGRCGVSRAVEFFLGSTTSRIVNRGAGLAVCVVE